MIGMVCTVVVSEFVQEGMEKWGQSQYRPGPGRNAGAALEINRRTLYIEG
jgi:hypothetical protein